MTEAVAVETRGRGRPRPDTTIARDDSAYTYIAGAGEAGVTRTGLSEALGVATSHAYLSLYRLSKAGRIEKRRVDGKFMWVALPPTPAA